MFEKYFMISLTVIHYNNLEICIRIMNNSNSIQTGENLKQEVTPLKVVTANSALRLRAVLDFEETKGTGKDAKKEQRVAGDEWLFEGPGN